MDRCKPDCPHCADVVQLNHSRRWSEDQQGELRPLEYIVCETCPVEFIPEDGESQCPACALFDQERDTFEVEPYSDADEKAEWLSDDTHQRVVDFNAAWEKYRG